ncbi:MAG: hypothetical protein OEV31_00845 [Gammaproteobacteria bacterium]|nr:hypothetical protein [Gammaproteobacteria bacterium]
MNRKNLSIALLTGAALTLAILPPAQAGKYGGGDTTPAATYDTSFAVEYSSTCLSGGCHGNNATLVDGYSKSLMTHAMVKCNTCHGTHTAAEVGKPKPNLTGYSVYSGSSGYTIPNDRCNTCHSGSMNRKTQNDAQACKNCHAPHVFPR